MPKFKNFSAAVYAFFLTAAVLLLSYLRGGLYPFGWGSLSWCDMNQQLIPLFCDFKDILAGEKSLFLNFSNAGGMNFYGVFCFFLCSPFTLAVAFVDKADIPFLMNILVLLKLSVAAFTASFVLKKLCPNLKTLTVTALGVSYALCGYGMLFYQNIMWLDIQYLFPLIVLGIYKLTKEQKPLLLTVTLTLSVIFNFYISFAVFIFVILFFGIFAIFNPKANRRTYINLMFSGVLSLFCSAFVWLPSLLQYFASARSGGFFDNIKNSSFFGPYDTTLTILLCSGIIFGALSLILPRLYHSEKEMKFLFVVFFLTSLPLIIEPINLMWHTGSYMSFPARYGFIPVFIGLLLAAKELEKVKSFESRKPLGLVFALVSVLLSIYGLGLALNNSETMSAYVNTLWGNREALKGQLLVCSFFALCFALLIFALKKGIIRQTLAGVLLCLTVALQGFASADIFILSAKDSLSIYNYQSIIALESKADKDRFYRVNTKGRITDANMIGAAGFGSLGHYTSLNDKTYMETARLFGYSGYWMETENWDGSILSDALLSVGYIAENNGQNFELKENPYYLGLGIKAEGEILKNLPKSDRLMSLGAAFEKMSGTKNPVTKYEPVNTKYCDIDLSKGSYSIATQNDSAFINYSVMVGTRQTLYFDAYNGFSTNLTEKINNAFSIDVNGNLLTAEYPAQKRNGLFELGSFENARVDITLAVNEDCEMSSFGVFSVDETLLESFVNSAETLNLKENKGRIEGTAEKGNYFVSIPYKDNYKITLNGKEVDYAKALGGFVAVELEKGGQLIISFIPKGFALGITISLIGIAILILVLKFKIFSEKGENIVYGIFIGAFGAVMLWVYIIPVIIKLKDLAF
ncbi:MAG: YfhO family protein [Clostridia bacterium]|nr:YfhO family protein [Clostridia bacterium]